MTGRLLTKDCLLGLARDEYDFRSQIGAVDDGVDGAVAVAVAAMLDDAIACIDDPDDRDRLREWYADFLKEATR